MELVSLILNFILGSGLLGAMIFYAAKKRKATAEAATAENNARESEFSIQKENIEFLASQLGEAWKEVEKMQALINNKRDQIINLITQTKHLEIELIEARNATKKAEMNSCLNLECKLRTTRGTSKN